jgi:hypothetical protein
MQRYYFHVRDGNTFVLDDEGSEHPNLAAVQLEANESLREIIADRVRSQGSTSDLRIEVIDDFGHVVHSASVPDVILSRIWELSNTSYDAEGAKS